MNTQTQTFRGVVTGSFGHVAAGNIRLSVHNWAGIQIKKAVFASLRKKDEDNLFDDSRMAFLKEKLKGVVEDTTVTPEVDSLQITRALAASLILLANHIATPNPENGKRDEGKKRYLRPINVVQEEAATYAAETSNDASTIRSNCESLCKDATPEQQAKLKARRDERLAGLTAKKSAEFATYFTPYVKEFWDAMKEFETADESDLIDLIEEALTDAGQEPWKYVLKASVYNMDRQRANELEGRKVFIDEGTAQLARLAKAQGVA